MIFYESSLILYPFNYLFIDFIIYVIKDLVITHRCYRVIFYSSNKLYRFFKFFKITEIKFFITEISSVSLNNQKVLIYTIANPVIKILNIIVSIILY